MPDVGLTHLALPVTDLDASVAFYESFAAMRVVHRREGVAWLSDGTRPFAIVLARAERVEHPLGPFAHLGVACATRAEIDEKVARARAEGRLASGPNDSGPPVGYWVFIRDPDGHILELSHGQDVAEAVAREFEGA